MIKRGEVYWVNLDPTIGAEIRKTRPAVIISNDINNQNAQTVSVLPLTSSTTKVHPFEVLIEAGVLGPESGKIKANQIRTIDKKRLGGLLGMLPARLIAKAEDALRLHLDLA